ncbi:GNAT family N-acetyltransferase [Phocaeicola salanitronis]|uniref:GNAT family N-acetyltransferase n=1 Tax=Phocaeicola salanitronis TaxID=376805 RepID=UPI0023F9DD0B|nr:GNAT family N-acetyltransferase [Phocaeicola salanitronis]
MTEEALRTIDTLIIAFAANKPIGFMCIQDQKIEALFLAPGHIGKGIGKRLIRLAINRYKAFYIDVNEQNAQATDIYRHLGFEVFRRNETDSQGNPFPILHMQLKLHKGGR